MYSITYILLHLYKKSCVLSFCIHIFGLDLKYTHIIFSNHLRLCNYQYFYKVILAYLCNFKMFSRLARGCEIIKLKSESKYS